MKSQMVEIQTPNNYSKYLIELLNLSINGLEDLYIDETKEFILKKKLVDGKVEFEGKSLRYTLINLLGLYKAECNQFKINLNLKEILKYQINNPDIYTGVGEIGLLLWATALIDPKEINNIVTKVNFTNILSSYKDAKIGLTTELSWLLTGLLEAATFNEDFNTLIGDLPHRVYSLIRNNYGGSGIFMHQSSENLIGKFRGNIASFADQVYPIFAFTLYSQIYKNKEAQLIVQECALKICEHQGERGEWMWHYDARDGKLISKYPVYSVHQDAMAPIALFAAQRAIKMNLEEYIYKGLTWLNNNSLNLDMVDRKNNMIFRAIGPRKVHRKIKSTLTHLGLSKNEGYSKVETVDECWSYHLGWVLFAFSGRVNNFRDSNLVKKNEDIRAINKELD